MLLNIEPEWWLSELFKTHLNPCKEHTCTSTHINCKEYQPKNRSIHFVYSSHSKGTVYQYISVTIFPLVNCYAIIKLNLTHIVALGVYWYPNYTL